MNILLVSPSQEAAYGKMTPPAQMHMGLAYIAAVLEKERHRVEIIDMDAERLSVFDFAETARRGNYDMAGFTVTSPTFFSSLELAEKIKKYSPRTFVAFGGIHPTIKPLETVNFSCVDGVVIGEGEITMRELAEALAERRDLSTVNGLMYKKDGSVKETPPRSLIEDLDRLPFPARHLFKNKNYTYPDALYSNTAPMITSRGCPGMCTYCNAHSIFKRVFRPRSAKNIVDETESLVKNMGTREIHIWDDNFATIKDRVFQVRDEVRKRKIKVKFAFPNGMRADFLNKEVMQALKEMGTYSIAIGVESGSQDVLDKARKGIKLEKIEEIFRLARQMRFETWAFFIIGLPGETAHTIKKTIDFAIKINPDITKFHILKPYPGTEVYDYLRSRNFLLSEDYNRFGIHTPPVHRLETLAPYDMLEWQRRAYRAFYLRPSEIAKQLFRLKTFNRFMLNLKAGGDLAKTMLFK